MMAASPSISRLSRQVPVHEVFQASVGSEQPFTNETTVDFDVVDRESHDRFSILGFGGLDGLITIELTCEADIIAMIVLGGEAITDTYEVEAWLEIDDGGGFTEVEHSRKVIGAE